MSTSHQTTSPRDPGSGDIDAGRAFAGKPHPGLVLGALLLLAALWGAHFR